MNSLSLVLYNNVNLMNPNYHFLSEGEENFRKGKYSFNKIFTILFFRLPIAI